MAKPKPPAEAVFPFLRANLGTHALAPLTGQDSRALQAATQIIELYSYDRDPAILQALRLVVRRMQPSTRELAYHAIAMCMDWSDRSRIWLEAGLEELPRLRVCAFEPGGSRLEAA